MSGATIVTGASNGIGRAIADHLADQGQTVINLDIKPPSNDSRAIHYRIDLTDADGTEAVLKEVTEEHAVTRLVNNAGFAVAESLEDTTLDNLDRTVDINLRGAIQCAQAVVPAMKAAGFGRIVNIASRAALGKQLRTSYAATKGGLISMARVWALELAEHGITVNAIGPGPVATELFNAVNPPGAARTQALIEEIPVKRVGQPGDIARTAAFFLDEDNGYITGQVLYVCGGLSAGLGRI